MSQALFTHKYANSGPGLRIKSKRSRSIEFSLMHYAFYGGLRKLTFIVHPALKGKKRYKKLYFLVSLYRLFKILSFLKGYKTYRELDCIYAYDILRPLSSWGRLIGTFLDKRKKYHGLGKKPLPSHNIVGPYPF